MSSLVLAIGYWLIGYSRVARRSNNGTVAAAQKELTKLGYYHGSIDGVIGPETEKAVRWFQSVDRLPVNGQLNDQTLRALNVS